MYRGDNERQRVYCRSLGCASGCRWSSSCSAATCVRPCWNQNPPTPTASHLSIWLPRTDTLMSYGVKTLLLSFACPDIRVVEIPLASPGERNGPKMCTALLQIANSGWNRHQQTVGVWNSTASGCTLWEDGGGPLAAGCKSVRLSRSPPVRLLIALTKNKCC